MQRSISGLGEAVTRQLAERGGANSAAEPATTAQLLQEFSPSNSDNHDAGLSKALARLLISEIGVQRAAPAIERIRAALAGGAGKADLLRGRSTPRVLSPASSSAEVPSANFSQGMAAVRAALAGPAE